MWSQVVYFQGREINLRIMSSNSDLGSIIQNDACWFNNFAWWMFEKGNDRCSLHHCELEAFCQVRIYLLYALPTQKLSSMKVMRLYPCCNLHLMNEMIDDLLRMLWFLNLKQGIVNCVATGLGEQDIYSILKFEWQQNHYRKAYCIW